MTPEGPDPIYLVWSEMLASEGFKVSYGKTSQSGQKELWSIFISWFNKYKKPVLENAR